MRDHEQAYRTLAKVYGPDEAKKLIEKLKQKCEPQKKS